MKREDLADNITFDGMKWLHSTDHFSRFFIGHTYDAPDIERLLRKLKGRGPRRLHCLIGGRGGRDMRLQYEIGVVVGKYADMATITTDDPGRESVEAINAEIIRGLAASNSKHQFIPDRQEAIRHLVDHAGPEDIVLIIARKEEGNSPEHFISDEDMIESYLLSK